MNLHDSLYRTFLVLFLLGQFLVGQSAHAFTHPLKLSICEIEYSSDQSLLTIDLKLFLTDVNEALVFDPNSTKLAFCQPNESVNADPLLLNYLNHFFYVKVNEEVIELKIKSKELSGEGDNTALGISFEYEMQEPLKTLKVKNAVLTDLFFDQSNIVYVHVDDESKSIMLNKKTTTHQFTF